MNNVEEVFQTDPIQSLGLPQPVTIGADASVGAALEAVKQHGMGYILVLDGGKPAGIMSEQEVLMRIVARSVDYRDSVSKFISRNPTTLTEKHRIADAIRLMNETGDHNIPIVDEAGNAVGVLRTLDIIHFLAEAFPAQVLNLPPEPHQVMAQPEGG